MANTESTTQADRDLDDLPEVKTTTRVEYAGLTIKPGHDGRWYVTEDGANILPGATYGRTEQEALQLADVLLAVDRDSQKFWHLLRAIQRQELRTTVEDEPVRWPGGFDEPDYA